MQKFIVQLTAYCFVSAGHILLTLLIAFLWIPTPAIGEQQISLHDLNQSTLSSKESAVILTHLDYGPQILYETSHKVIATPYHRNADGILFWFNTMKMNNLEIVKTKLKSRNVTYILIDKRQNESFLANDKSSFFSLLVSNESLPDWIKPLALSPDQAEIFLLYEVEK